MSRPTSAREVVGPRGFPATFEQHDLTPGGTIMYFMSSPDAGDRFDGTWNVVEVDPPTRLVVEDAIVDDDGTPAMHSRSRISLPRGVVSEAFRG